jgi:hypothetical protein
MFIMSRCEYFTHSLRLLKSFHSITSWFFPCVCMLMMITSKNHHMLWLFILLNLGVFGERSKWSRCLDLLQHLISFSEYGWRVTVWHAWGLQAWWEGWDPSKHGGVGVLRHSAAIDNHREKESCFTSLKYLFTCF